MVSLNSRRESINREEEDLDAARGDDTFEEEVAPLLLESRFTKAVQRHRRPPAKVDESSKVDESGVWVVGCGV